MVSRTVRSRLPNIRPGRKKQRVPAPIVAGKDAMLKFLWENYDFGEPLNGRIELLIKADPLDDIPSLISNKDRDLTDPHRLMLGYVYGFVVILRHYPKNPMRHGEVTVLVIGCRESRSHQHAVERWPNNISAASGKRRPGYDKLIAWVKEVCDHRGWAW